MRILSEGKEEEGQDHDVGSHCYEQWLGIWKSKKEKWEGVVCYRSLV